MEAPEQKEVKISSIQASKTRFENCKTRSLSVIWYNPKAPEIKFAKALREIFTPLGIPVDPLV